ncbi:MAG: DNA-directed RNA polymerase subunit omega [Fimbriimonadaceae bacterium]
MLPSPNILLEFEHGKFVLSNLAAKRAKQIRDGAPPLVRIDSNHPLTIALAEIAAGKIKAIMPDVDHAALIETAEIKLLTDETMPAELGMLLPALDETEVALVSPIALTEDDAEHEAEVDEAADGLSLADLAGEDEEEAAEPAPAGEDDTLSLTEIAEQEESSEDEESQEN